MKKKIMVTILLIACVFSTFMCYFIGTMLDFILALALTLTVGYISDEYIL